MSCYRWDARGSHRTLGTAPKADPRRHPRLSTPCSGGTGSHPTSSLVLATPCFHGFATSYNSTAVSVASSRPATELSGAVAADRPLGTSGTLLGQADATARLLQCCAQLTTASADSLADACMAYAAAGCPTSSTTFTTLLAHVTSNARHLSSAHLAGVTQLLCQQRTKLSSPHVKHVCKAACSRMGSMELPPLITIFTTFSRMGCRPGSTHLRRFLQRLETADLDDAALQHQHQLSHHQGEPSLLLQALVAIAGLCPEPDLQLVRRLCAGLESTTGTMPPSDLAALAACLARLHAEPGHAILAQLGLQLQRHLGQGSFSQQQLCSLARALPRLQLPRSQALVHSTLLHDIASSITAVEAGAGDASAYAQLLALRLAAQQDDPCAGVMPEEQLQEALQWLQQQLPSCSSQDVAMLGHAVASAGCAVPSSWLASYCQAVQARLAGMDLHQLVLSSTALHGFSSTAAGAAGHAAGAATDDAAGSGAAPSAAALQQQAEALAQQRMQRLPPSELLATLAGLAKQGAAPPPSLQQAILSLLGAAAAQLSPSQQLQLLQACDRLHIGIAPALLLQAVDKLSRSLEGLPHWRLIELAELLGSQAALWYQGGLPAGQLLLKPAQRLLYATATDGMIRYSPGAMLRLLRSYQQLNVYPKAIGISWAARMLAAARASQGMFSGRQVAQLLVLLAWMDLHPAFEASHWGAEQQLVADLRARSDWQPALLQRLAGAAGAAGAAGGGSSRAALAVSWAAAKHGVLTSQQAAPLLVQQLQQQVSSTNLHALAASACLVLDAEPQDQAPSAQAFVANVSARCSRELDMLPPEQLHAPLQLLLTQSGQQLSHAQVARGVEAIAVALPSLPLKTLLLVPPALASGLQLSARVMEAFCSALSQQSPGTLVPELYRALQHMQSACSRQAHAQHRMQRAMQQLFGLACTAAHQLSIRQLYQLLAVGYQQQLAVPASSMPKVHSVLHTGVAQMPPPHRISMLLLTEQLGALPRRAWTMQQLAAALLAGDELSARMRLDAVLLLLRCSAAADWLLLAPQPQPAAAAAVPGVQLSQAELRQLALQELSLVLADTAAVSAGRLVDLLAQLQSAQAVLQLAGSSSQAVAACVAGRAGSLPPDRALRFVHLLGSISGSTSSPLWSPTAAQMDVLLYAVYPGSSTAQPSRLSAAAVLPLLQQLQRLQYQPSPHWMGTLLAGISDSLAGLPAQQLVDLGMHVVGGARLVPGARFLSSWLAAMVARHKELPPLQLAQVMQLLSTFRAALQAAAGQAQLQRHATPAQPLALGPLLAASQQPASHAPAIGLVASVARGGIVRSLRGRVQQLLRQYMVGGMRSSAGRQVLVDLLMVRAHKVGSGQLPALPPAAAQPAAAAGLRVAPAAGAWHYQGLLQLRVSRLLLAASAPAALLPAGSRHGSGDWEQGGEEAGGSDGSVLVSAPTEAVAAVLLKLLDVKLAGVLTRTGVPAASMTIMM